MERIFSNKIILTVIMLFLANSIFSIPDNKPITFYKIDLRQEVNQASFKKIQDGLLQAIQEGADYCILDINTYGGAVDAADSIRSMILRSQIPVIAYINIQAVSAGALISIACDSIYMREGGSFGAATVVNQSGEVMPDKYQSFMRAMMRSTAENHGKKIITENGEEKEVWRRNPDIAQSMVSKDSVLSFTPLEAIQQGYSEGMAESVSTVAAKVAGDNNYVIVEHKISVLKKIIYFLMSPYMQGILLMLIIGGIYFELQSPGIGFPLVAAITGAVLYFAPLYLEGLAQNWELIMFLIGVGLLFAEIFVIPGFGIAGVSGIILVIFSLAFAMIDNDLVFKSGDYNFRPLIKPFAIVLVSTTTSIFLSVYLANKLYGSRAFSHIVLHTNLDDNKGFVGVETNSLTVLIGAEGIVSTDLKPQGTIEVNGKRYPAQLDFGYAKKGDMIKIIKVEGGRLFVSRLLQ